MTSDLTTATQLNWIDLHHHPYHADFIAALRAYGVTQMAPGVPLPEWRIADSLQVMDRTGISAAILSLVFPAGGYDKTVLARRANEQSAALVADHPDRFAALASLPLPDVDAALSELEYALDVLGMEGVVLGASMSDGLLLSDPAFAPVFDELNRRRTVAFIHPSPAYRCTCTGGLSSRPSSRRRPWTSLWTPHAQWLGCSTAAPCAGAGMSGSSSRTPAGPYHTWRAAWSSGCDRTADA